MAGFSLLTPLLAQHNPKHPASRSLIASWEDSLPQTRCLRVKYDQQVREAPLHALCCFALLAARSLKHAMQLCWIFMLLAFSLSLSFRSDATAACQVRSGELGACFVRHTMPEAYVGTHTRNGPQGNFSEVLSFRGSGSSSINLRSQKKRLFLLLPQHTSDMLSQWLFVRCLPSCRQACLRGPVRTLNTQL